MTDSRPPPAPLAGVGVLITRPAHQAGPLAGLIERAGGTAILFPTLEIVPPADPGPLLTVLARLAEFDLAIFVSPNAVEQTFGWLRSQHRAWPATVRSAGVGAGSAAALERFGIGDVLAPSGRFDSEALLALPALQQVAGRRIVIFRGNGGRELLGDLLARRGAHVTYAECYRRTRPHSSTDALLAAWRRGGIHIVSITSTEGLTNLHAMLGDVERGWLLHTPVVVLSEAQAETCRRLGFAHEALIATAASDAAILEAIEAWRQGRFSL